MNLTYTGDGRIFELHGARHGSTLYFNSGNERLSLTEGLRRQF